MKNLRILEVEPHIIFIILLFCFKFMKINIELFYFWQPIIDNFILLIFLVFMLFRSIKLKWSWFSNRIIYSLIFIILLNSYTTLFGMDSKIYINWYIIPLLSLAYVVSTTTILEITYKLYKLWKNGKIKFY